MGRKRFGRPFHDNWWQTETGGIMIANFRPWTSTRARWGARCRASRPPSCAARSRRRRSHQRTGSSGGAGVAARLALDVSRLLREPERYVKCFRDGWYLTGDLARRDADGYYWFVGRSDDVIKTSGHLVGPFEVESVLMEHPAVAEAGVIGKPDPMASKSSRPLSSLKPGIEPAKRLRRELLAFARVASRCGVAPKEIDFIANLPKTRAGKIMRRC